MPLTTSIKQKSGKGLLLLYKSSRRSMKTERILTYLILWGDWLLKRFEYVKLADTLAREACLFRNIISQERYFCEYFRVGYYGRGFDSQIQGKEYIYRGFELERLADFIPVFIIIASSFEWPST